MVANAIHHRRNGPRLGTDTAAHLMTYDVWNRLVKITDNNAPTTIATYAYDGVGRRIKKTTGGDTFDYYYNSSWQVLEVRKNGDTDPYKQYIYGTSYIDEALMVYVDENQDGDHADTDEGEHYFLRDASYSIIAYTEADGTIKERYRYTPYGKRTVMDASFADKAGTDYNQQRGFQGLLHDDESGLIENRNRMLDPETGRFLQRDMLGYPDGMNAYGAYHVMWQDADPAGLCVATCPCDVGDCIIRFFIENIELAEFNLLTGGAPIALTTPHGVTRTIRSVWRTASRSGLGAALTIPAAGATPIAQGAEIELEYDIKFVEIECEQRDNCPRGKGYSGPQGDFQWIRGEEFEDQMQIRGFVITQLKPNRDPPKEVQDQIDAIIDWVDNIEQDIRRKAHRTLQRRYPNCTIQ